MFISFPGWGQYIFTWEIKKIEYLVFTFYPCLQLQLWKRGFITSTKKPPKLCLSISSGQTLLYFSLFLFFLSFQLFKSGCYNLEERLSLMMFTQSCCEPRHHVTVSTKKREPERHASRQSALLCVLNEEQRIKDTDTLEKNKTRVDHTSGDWYMQPNIRRPLTTQVLAHWGNIKRNTEAWKRQMQLAMQSSQHQAGRLCAE